MSTQYNKQAHPRLPRQFWEALQNIHRHYTRLAIQNWRREDMGGHAPIFVDVLCLQHYLEIAHEEGWVELSNVG